MTQNPYGMMVVLAGADGQPLPQGGGAYQVVAASQTDKTLGTPGAVGDVLSSLLIVPATGSPGAVTVKDGSTTVFTFPGGASGLLPISIPLGLVSQSGAWNITTGTNVSVVAAGNFTTT